MNKIFDRLRHTPTEEKISPGEDFELTIGKQIIFGSDPKKSGKWDSQHKSIKLIAGIRQRQLSRAAVKIGLTNEGDLELEGLTENNYIHVQHLGEESEGSGLKWLKTEIKGKVPEDQMKIFGHHFIIDIETADRTLVRLNDGGKGGADGKLNSKTFRVAINPSRKDLNEPKH